MATTLTNEHVTPAFSPLSPAWLKGRMRGALICSTFGAVWMFEAVFFGGIATPVWLVVVGAVSAGAIVWPLMRLRSFRRIPFSASDRDRWAAVAAPYWINCAIEWVLCFGVAFWLSHIHQYALIPECLGVIIGLHFLPLGKIFGSPLYYITGTAMVLGSLASFMVHAGSLRNITSFGINGLSLWGTAAVIVGQDWLSRKEEED